MITGKAFIFPGGELITEEEINNTINKHKKSRTQKNGYTRFGRITCPHCGKDVFHTNKPRLTCKSCGNTFPNYQQTCVMCGEKFIPRSGTHRICPKCEV